MDGGGTSSDGGDTKDGGGCSTGSPGAGALLVVALAFVRRRRLVAVVQ
jgi:Synergist-CTERM protein sorting domain-containing protein